MVLKGGLTTLSYPKVFIRTTHPEIRSPLGGFFFAFYLKIIEEKLARFKKISYIYYVNE